MATETKNETKSDSKPKTSTRKKSGSSGSDESTARALYNWGSSQSGMLVGAAVAGAAVGIAANMGRKMLVQMASTAGGSWDEALTAEHRLTLATFEKIEATNDSQTSLRSTLLAKLKYQLTKHALEEENVIYPALRQANIAHEADSLEGEHGYVKTYLYELETMPNGTPEWLARVRDFHAMIEQHMAMEEKEVFPALKAILSDTQSSRLTSMMNKEGYKFA